MPKKAKKPTAVDADTLRQWKAKGASSPILDARLEFMEIEGIARYVRQMQGLDRVYPNMLPTAQVSGRWSTTDPPIVTFPPELRGGTKSRPDGSVYIPPPLLVPDPGTFWISWDFDALHAKIATAYSGDKTDLDAFNQGWDIHTLTACGMFGMPFPPIRTKALHKAPECEAWRLSWTPPWEGGDDRRRHLAKTMRYATLLGKNEHSALQASGVEKLNLARADILRFAKLYLDSKPALVAAKWKIWNECASTGVARTFMGRRRRLFGDWWTRAKDGWSHVLQGGEVDIQMTCFIDIQALYPDSWLVWNAHDGAPWGFPDTYDPPTVKSVLSDIVERTWNVVGSPIKTTADWKLWLPDATVTPMK